MTENVRKNHEEMLETLKQLLSEGLKESIIDRIQIQHGSEYIYLSKRETTSNN